MTAKRGLLKAKARTGPAPCAIGALMTDTPDHSEETPIQRALRLKKAAIDAKPKPPRGGKFQREQAAGVQAGKSKPWMTR
ncbi:hypothetical protein AQ619_12460 [Caulobacter henricii]|uniref:Uncharacterized protein n=2 Tax=Caulobacter henricii TaxID=69395 RepID=A0A0P0P0T9_9CAUL|nr:hypothetical protein AQ619_12460 [Caulobacter henricii]